MEQVATLFPTNKEDHNQARGATLGQRKVLEPSDKFLDT